MDNIDDTYLNNAIKELVDLLGVSETLNPKDYSPLVKSKNYNECINKISSHFGLQCKYNIKMVPKGYSATKRYYQSSGLVETDDYGKGSAGITAQVHIPGNLPLFGDLILKKFTIDVIVGEEYSENEDTFVSIMAHEIAHLLLATLRHPKSDNEIYADLVPLVLGFSKIVKHGRKVIDIVDEQDGVLTKQITTTTKYGYLNDHQFNYASNMVDGILIKFKDRKNRLFGLSDQAGNKIKQLQKRIEKRNSLLNDLPKHSKKRVSFDDSKIIVTLYGNSNIYDYEMIIQQAEKLRKEVYEGYNNITHYTKKVGKKMNEAESQITKTNNLLSSVLLKLETDINIINRNLSLPYRLIRLMR